MHHIDHDLKVIKELIMATRAENIAAIHALTAQVAKIGAETKALQAENADLKAQLAAAQSTTPDEDAAMAGLTQQVQAVDDLVPDAG